VPGLTFYSQTGVRELSKMVIFLASEDCMVGHFGQFTNKNEKGQGEMALALLFLEY